MLQTSSCLEPDMLTFHPSPPTGCLSSEVKIYTMSGWMTYTYMIYYGGLGSNGVTIPAIAVHIVALPFPQICAFVYPNKNPSILGPPNHLDHPVHASNRITLDRCQNLPLRDLLCTCLILHHLRMTTRATYICTAIIMCVSSGSHFVSFF